MSQTPDLPSAALTSLPHAQRALVVDDHEDSARGIEIMLKSLGFETEVAGDGIDALRHASMFKPNLFLIDISMPKLDGYDTCGVIRAQPWAQGVRLVAIMGHAREEVRQRAQQAGFDAYLLKPVEFENLRRVTLPSQLSP